MAKPRRVSIRARDRRRVRRLAHGDQAGPRPARRRWRHRTASRARAPSSPHPSGEMPVVGLVKALPTVSATGHSSRAGRTAASTRSHGHPFPSARRSGAFRCRARHRRYPPRGPAICCLSTPTLSSPRPLAASEWPRALPMGPDRRREATSSSPARRLARGDLSAANLAPPTFGVSAGEPALLGRLVQFGSKGSEARAAARVRAADLPRATVLSSSSS